MRRLILGAATCAAAWALQSSALAYDYVADVLIGNTVEVIDVATGKSIIYKVKADKTVARTADGKTVVGSWTAEPTKICAVYPGENNGQPQCSEIPKNPVTVPGERDTEVPNPTAGQPPIKLKIKYAKGQ